MSEDQLDFIINNEKEWRRLLFRKIDKIESKMDLLHLEHVQMRTELARMKVWNRIWRTTSGVILTGVFGLLIHWIKGKLTL